MRVRARWIVNLLAGAALVASTALVQVTPAHAGVWHAYPPAANRTCAKAERPYNGVDYQLCLEFNDRRTQVRAIAFVNPGAYTNYQVNLRMWFGGGPNVTDSCPTITTNGSRACYTGWSDLRQPYVAAEATFGIAGAWMPKQRVIDMQLAGKAQLQTMWCGPAAAQTVIATMGISAPSQETLAQRMGTGGGGTPYGVIDNALNDWVPQDWPYREVAVPGSGLPRYAGLNRIMQSLSRGRPVVVMVKPGQLPWSNGAGTDRHFLVVHGYGGRVTEDAEVAELMPWTPMNFKVWDPSSFLSSRPYRGEFSISVDDLFKAAYGADFPVDGIPAISS